MKKYVFGLTAFILFCLSYLIGYVEESAFHLLIPIKAGLIVASSVLFYFSCDRDSNEHFRRSYSILNIIILFYEILLLFAVGRTVLLIHDYPGILSFLVWITCPIINLIRFRADIVSVSAGLFKDRTRNVFMLSSFLTAVIALVLSLEPGGVRFTWDSDTLYQLIYKLDFESLFDAKQMTFHSHVSIVYAHILVLLKLLFGNIRTAYFILNTLCIFAASFGMTFLLRCLVPAKKPGAYIICNAMFVFSPWVLGMSTYYIYDYYIWCLMPLLLYFAFKRNWLWFFVIGLMITFSKASGLIVFGSVCAGVLISDVVSYIKENAGSATMIRDVLVHIITRCKYWLFASAAVIFFVFFSFGISEDVQFEDTRFGIDAGHILHELKIYSFTNFIWIFGIATIILLLLVFVQKKLTVSDECRRMILTALISDVIFILFNCLCITFKLPRYMDSHIAVVYILASVLFLSIGNSYVMYALTGAITAVTFAGAFRMIDPVSLTLFKTINVGTHNIVDFEQVDRPSLEDSIICNREYYSYEILLGQALTYVMDSRNEGDEIMFSLGDDVLTWGFSGGRYSYDFGSGKHYFEEFYDTKISGLANGYDYEYFNDTAMIPFDMHYIFPAESIEKATDEGGATVFYYLYMPSLNGGRENEIREKFNITNEETFAYRGWEMSCISFSR